METKKEELKKSIHPTYANTLKNYIKLKIEMLDWFLNLMESIKSELKGVDNNVRVFRSLINNEIQRYEVQKNGKNVEMDKMVEYNDRIKCLQSLSLILLTYEYDLDELVSVFD